MSWMDDNVAVIGDWVPPSPSPRTFFSAMLGDDIGTKPPENNKSEEFFLGAPEWMNLATVGNKETRQVSAVGDHTVNSGLSTEQRSNSRGGLGERIAARAGFNAPKLNTEGIRSADLSVNTEVRSPYLTIPPGLSPTTLLDSPVFLSNSLVQPSPTTGKFPFFPNNAGKGSGLPSDTSETTKKAPFEDNSSSFAFRPLGDSAVSSLFSSRSKMTQAMLPQDSFPRMDASIQSESSFQSRKAEQSKVWPQNGSGYPAVTEHSWPLAERDSAIHDIPSQQKAFSSNAIVCCPDRASLLDDQGNEEGDLRGGAIDPMVGDVGGGPDEDGYNWRKYGQKQVKGSEYPRSYYKCTHTNCPVKKKVERSQEGHITEIIYKGTHNHPKPAPNRRSVIGGPNVHGEMLSEHDGDPAWANMQKAATAGAADWRQDNNLEVTSSPSEGPEARNAATPLPAQNGTRFESADQADGSCTFSNDEGEDDQQTHGSVSMGYDADGDESESKRRKIEAYATDMSGATRAIREPRVVVQTTSEVDILDDGYRWRKYGQKVVKGNPNPRSYYKCTSAGCTVRKHVERASHDLKSVITTYEGKHNHDVPASRNSNHVNSGPSGVIPSQSAASPARNQVHRPEPSQVRNMMARFDGPASLGSFNLPGGRAPAIGPSHGFSFGTSQPGLANLGPGQGKLPMMPVHAFLMMQQQQQQQQQRPANEMGLMLQKGEPKVEPGSEPGLNLSNSSAAYQQMMNRLPLGHQM